MLVYMRYEMKEHEHVQGSEHFSLDMSQTCQGNTLEATG